ncbi:MAG: hypothetical protein H6728_08495 [Myxococcales bacterium]|nr:hypothetical protein [Myxococcales bacterium]MCB9643099.1 hypothetical protein [Myxococcales bacterium]
MAGSDRVPSTRFLCFLMLLAGVAVFGQVLDFSFVTTDDWDMIVRYPLVNDWSGQGWWERLITRKHSYAMPLSVASFALDWSLWGQRPGMFHATNLALHLMCVLAFFGLVSRWFGHRAAFLVSLVMLLHPMQVESVGYISQRKDILACLFALLGVYGLSWIVQGRRVGLGILVVLGASLLAGLSKPTAMLVGPIFAVSWWFVIPKERRLKFLWAKLLLIAMGPAFLALNVYVNRLYPLTLRYEKRGIFERIAWVGHTIAHYTSSFFWPMDLSPRVPMPAPAWTFAALFGLFVIPLLFWVVLIFALKRHVWPAVLGVVWVAGIFLPISNIIPISRYVADSYFYLAMPGVLWLIAWFLARHDLQISPVFSEGKKAVDQTSLNKRSWGWGIWSAVALICSLLGVLSYYQVGHWRNEETLFRYLVQRWPDQKEPLGDLLGLLRKKGAVQEAFLLEERYLKRAVLTHPASMDARHHLMRLYLREKRPKQAFAVLLAIPKSMQQQASYWEARLEWAMRLHRMPEAYRAVKQILLYNPQSPRRKMLSFLQQFVSARPSSSRPTTSTVPASKKAVPTSGKAVP